MQSEEQSVNLEANAPSRVNDGFSLEAFAELINEKTSFKEQNQLPLLELYALKADLMRSLTRIPEEALDQWLQQKQDAHPDPITDIKQLYEELASLQPAENVATQQSEEKDAP